MKTVTEQIEEAMSWLNEFHHSTTASYKMQQALGILASLHRQLGGDTARALRTTYVPFSDEDNSKDAAKRVGKVASRQKRVVLDYFMSAGARGFTDQELQDRLTKDEHFIQARARRNSLEREGLIARSGSRRNPLTGNKNTVFVYARLTPAQQNLL